MSNKTKLKGALTVIENKSKVDVFGQLLLQCFDTVSNKMEISWKDFSEKYQKLQQPSQQSQTAKKKVVESSKKQPNKLRIKVNLKSTAKESQAQTQKQASGQTPKEDPSPRLRTKSNTTQLKSLKKTNQLLNQKEEQEKKAQRLKQIGRRKLELMERLKKIDVQLQEAKRQASPTLNKQEKSLYQSHLNKSFVANSSRANINKGTENVVEMHSKVVGVLERINNQKIRRQEKIADQFRKKQQAELIKLQQLQRKKNQQLQQKNKRNQMAIQKLKKQNKTKKTTQVKLNQFSEKAESSLLPTTMIKGRNQRSSFKDGLFFEQKSSHNLLTERDLDTDGEQIRKQYEKAIANEVKKQEKKIEQQLSQSLVKQQKFAEAKNEQPVLDKYINQFTLNPNQNQNHLVV